MPYSAANKPAHKPLPGPAFPATFLSMRGRGPIPYMDIEECEDLAAYLREIRRIPLLDAEQELFLARRARSGDEDARQRLVEANLRLVVSAAHSYARKNANLLDIIQEGNLGLIRAVKLFDPEQNCRLANYALWWICQAINRALEEKTYIIRVPSYAHRQLRLLRHASNRFLEHTGREPRTSELEEATGLDAERILALQRATSSTISLDKPIAGIGEPQTLGELVPDTDADTVENLGSHPVIEDEVKHILRERLTTREYQVLQWHFGLFGSHQASGEEIAQRLGISPERVRQIQVNAFGKLQRCELLKSLLSGTI